MGLVVFGGVVTKNFTQVMNCNQVVKMEKEIKSRTSTYIVLYLHDDNTASYPCLCDVTVHKNFELYGNYVAYSELGITSI